MGTSQSSLKPTPLETPPVAHVAHAEAQHHRPPASTSPQVRNQILKRHAEAELAGTPPAKRRSSAGAISLSEHHDHPIDEITAELERSNDHLQSKLRGLKETFLLAQNESSNRVLELEVRIGQLSADKIAIQEEIAQTHADMAIYASELHSEIRRLKIENADLKKKVQEMQLAKEEAESRAQQATNEKAALESENKRMSAILDGMERLVSSAG